MEEKEPIVRPEYRLTKEDKKQIEIYLVECDKCGYVWLRRQMTPEKFFTTCPKCTLKMNIVKPNVRYGIINTGNRAMLVAISPNGYIINIPDEIHKITQKELKFACPIIGGRILQFQEIRG